MQISSSSYRRSCQCAEINLLPAVIVQSPELKAKLAVHLPLDVDLAPGLWLSVCGRVTKPDSARNRAGDYRIYLRGQGVYAFVEVDEFTVLEKKNRARLFLNSLREYVKIIIEKICVLRSCSPP